MFQNIQSLREFRSAVEGVQDLTGNSGKRLRRVLDRYLAHGFISLPIEVPRQMRLFEFARYLNLVLEGCEMAEAAMADYEPQMPSRFRAEITSLEHRQVMIRIFPGKAIPPVDARPAAVSSCARTRARPRTLSVGNGSPRCFGAVRRSVLRAFLHQCWKQGSGHATEPTADVGPV